MHDWIRFFVKLASSIIHNYHFEYHYYWDISISLFEWFFTLLQFSITHKLKLSITFSSKKYLLLNWYIKTPYVINFFTSRIIKFIIKIQDEYFFAKYSFRLIDKNYSWHTWFTKMYRKCFTTYLMIQQDQFFLNNKIWHH